MGAPNVRIGAVRAGCAAGPADAGRSGSRPASVESQPATDQSLPHIETLDRLAERACLCGMAGREFGALTREFERLTAGLEAEYLATASDPLSSDLTCFPQLGENACVMTKVDVVASRGDFACTLAQADELEAVFMQALPPGSSDLSAGNAALIRRLRGMREELEAKLPQAECDRV